MKTAISEIRKAVTKFTLTDAKKLWLLHHMYNHYCGETSKFISERRSWHKADEKYGENGKIAIVFSGMDCDCVQWGNSVHVVDSDWRSIEKEITEEHEEAEGPIGYHFEKPSVAKQLKRTSRDLILEAFEDGHPWSVHI